MVFATIRTLNSKKINLDWYRGFMRDFKRTASVLLAGFIFIASSLSPVGAQTTGQTANGFRISPVRNELTIEKGKVYAQEHNIQVNWGQ